MRYYSTRSRSQPVSFAHAVLRGLAEDGGLYVAETIPEYRSAVLSSLSSMSFHDIAFETIRPFARDDIPDAPLRDIIENAFNFPAPVIEAGRRGVAELFHGPTAAFKDFGARFMARAFAYLRREESKPLMILVATSGDTGGAVAGGFFEVEGISVTVLYPKGRVTPLQEKQIAGLGGNISALAVEGSFDDCQRLVKAAFSRDYLRKKFDLSSANSINIARLIPQAVYYAASAAKHPGAVFCVPSGNFGNLTAGLYAREMGAPVSRFIAATNINKTIPEYLESGVYNPRPSIATISNAMDVGAPSNFERMSALRSHAELQKLITGVFVDDGETKDAIKKVYDETGYIADPHGAVGFRAADIAESRGLLSGEKVIVLETAHPAKFAETVEPIVGKVPVPPQLALAEGRRVSSQTIPATDDALDAVLRGE